MKKLIGIAVILAAAGVAFAGEMEQTAVSADMRNLDLQTIRTMDTSSLANPVPQRDVSFTYPYYRNACMAWGFGYSGTFSCPSGYMGAARTCFLKDQDDNQVASWGEEGCAALSDPNGNTGYCVRGCDNSGWKGAAFGTEALKAPVSAPEKTVMRGCRPFLMQIGVGGADETVIIERACTPEAKPVWALTVELANDHKTAVKVYSDKYPAESKLIEKRIQTMVLEGVSEQDADMIVGKIGPSLKAAAKSSTQEEKDKILAAAMETLITYLARP